MNRRGVAMAEAICTLTLLTGIFVVSLQYARIAVARLWLDHHLYGALVCAAEGNEISYCHHSTSRKVKQNAFTTDKLDFVIRKGVRQWEGSYKWIGFGGVTIVNQMSFELPKVRRVSFLPW